MIKRKRGNNPAGHGRGAVLRGKGSTVLAPVPISVASPSKEMLHMAAIPANPCFSVARRVNFLNFINTCIISACVRKKVVYLAEESFIFC
jgi:hypothetical protein